MLVARHPEVSRVRHLDSSDVVKIRLCASSDASLGLAARLETKLVIRVHSMCWHQGRELQSHECSPGWRLDPVRGSDICCDKCQHFSDFA